MPVTMMKVDAAACTILVVVKLAWSLVLDAFVGVDYTESSRLRKLFIPDPIYLHSMLLHKRSQLLHSLLEHVSFIVFPVDLLVNLVGLIGVLLNCWNAICLSVLTHSEVRNLRCKLIHSRCILR